MEDQEKEEKGPQINVELTDEMAEGVYSNLVMIAHAQSEFVIDFIRVMPGVPKAKVKSRVIVTPDHARRILAALRDNIEKYEETFGKIQGNQEAPSFPLNFGGTLGEA